MHNDPLLGHIIDGKYRVDAQIGAGGMGTIYRATRLKIGDVVAIKILHAELLREPKLAERFQREAQAAARLKHPNVVTVHDFGVSDDGTIYFVMELVDGPNLRMLIKDEGPMPTAKAAEIVRQVCAALGEAHRQNIIHRDIKPANIAVNTSHDGMRVKVLDFGIASLRGGTMMTFTQTGAVMGTPAYMSPEQCLGEDLDARSDIYSLGVVLFEMLAGVVPFNSPTATAVVMQHVQQAPPPLRVLNVSISSAVEDVVLRALAKRREDRPQSAKDFADELSAAVADGAAGLQPGPRMIDAADMFSNGQLDRTMVQHAFYPPAKPAAPQRGKFTGRTVVSSTILITLVALAMMVVTWTRAHIGSGAIVANDIATIDRVRNPGVFTEYTIPTPNSDPSGIVTGPDGALWFVESVGNKIGRLDLSGNFTEYKLPTTRSFPSGIAAGTDGSLWFTEGLSNRKIGRVTISGKFTEFTIRNNYYAITSGPDGALWFAEFAGLGRITTSGALTEHALLPSTANSGGYDITTGPDGALWFTISEQTTITSTMAGARFTGSLGRMTTSGVFTKYKIPTENVRALGIAAGPDGALWFTESHEINIDMPNAPVHVTTRYTGGKVGRMTTSGTFIEYAIPTANGVPTSITGGRDGALWFTEVMGNKIGRISTSGAITEYPIPTANSGPRSITTGPDGALWFVEYKANKIARLAPH